MFEHVEFFRSVRYPEKYVGVASFALAGLTGLGVELILPSARGERPAVSFPLWPWAKNRPFFSWRRDGRPQRSADSEAPFLSALCVLLLSLVFWMVCRFLRSDLETLVSPLLVGGARDRVSPAMAVDDLVRSGFCLGFFLSVSLFVREAMRWAGRSWLAYAPCFLIFFDLFLANSYLAPTSPSLYTKASHLGQSILAREGGQALGRFRIFRDPYIPSPRGLTYSELREWERDTLKPNLAALDGLEHFAGLNVATPWRFQWMTTQVLSIDLLPVFNVKYAIVPLSRVPDLSAHLTWIQEFQGAVLLEFKQTFPRAYWVRSHSVVTDPASLARLFPVHDFSRSVLLEPGPEAGSPEVMTQPGDRLIPAFIRHYQPNRVAVEVTAPAEGWLVLNDLFFPGWRAWVDGQEVEILRANGLVRAVRVAGGTHNVVFAYHPHGLWLGLVLSGLMLSLGVALAFLERSRER